MKVDGEKAGFFFVGEKKSNFGWFAEVFHRNSTGKNQLPDET